MRKRSPTGKNTNLSHGRICAVSGGTYVLGHPIQSISSVDTPNDGAGLARYSIAVEGVSGSILATTIIGSPLSEAAEIIQTERSLIRGILILDRPIHVFRKLIPESASADEIDTICLTFPPKIFGAQSLDESVSCIITGNGTMSCPKSQCEYYPSPLEGRSLRSFQLSSISLLL